MNKLLKYWSISTTIAFVLFFIITLSFNGEMYLWDIFVALAMGSLIIILVKTFKETEKNS
ncbi:MAG: hypothetical protein GX053_02545 [Tissierella sp.]|nr:hypothetical protein [Tissierella sp.]